MVSAAFLTLGGIASFIAHAAKVQDDNSFLWFGALFTGLGVAGYLIKSEPESQYLDYKSWKATLELPEDKQLVRFGIAPATKGNGAMFGLQIAFD